jgi:hypothetical protein
MRKKLGSNSDFVFGEIQPYKKMYKTPRIEVRGVFLMEKMAVSGASFRYGQLELEDWRADPMPEAPSRTEDVAIYF